MRKRYRRNPDDELSRALAALGPGLGIVVNPKNYDPCFPFAVAGKKRSVAFHAGSDMVVRSPFATYPTVTRPMGMGYFDDGDHGSRYDTSESGYPRVHTPDGVRVQKRGHGTVLYTSLCLGAKLTTEGELSLDINPEAPGISSNEHRSNAAEQWWRHARERGLSYRRYITGSEPETVTNRYEPTANVNRRSQANSLWDEAADYIADREGHSTNDLISMSIDIEATFEVEEEEETETEQKVDIYPFDPEDGCPGAKTLCAFYGVSDGGILTLPEGDFWFDADVFSTILLEGCAPEVIAYIQQVARHIGRRDLFEEIALVTILNKRAIDIAEAEQEPYADLRPNPSLKASEAAKRAFHSTLSRKERVLLEKRSETIANLGMNAFAIDD